MAKEKPWYYAILPATIRYAEDLTELQKLLYAEITALAQANGYCYASNSYFANLYKKTSKRISSTIQDMAKKWYLEVKQNKEWWWSREIYIGEIKNIRKSFKIPANPIPLETDSPIPEKKEGAIPLETDTLSHSTGNIIIQDNTTSVNRVEEPTAPTPSEKNIEFIHWMRDTEIRGKFYISVWNEKTWSSEIMNSELKKGIYDIRSVAVEDFSSRVEKFVAIKDLIVRKKAEKYFFFPIWDWTLQDFLKHVNKFYGEDSVILSRLARAEEKQKAVRILNSHQEAKQEIREAKPKSKVDLTEFRQKASVIFGR